MAAGVAAPAAQTIVVENAPPVIAEIHHSPPISGFTTLFGVSVNPMVILGLAVAIVLVYLIWDGKRKNNFNPWDLIQDVRAEGVRVASLIKTSFMAAFLVSTMVVLDQEFKNTLSEGIFMAYLGTWCASLIAKVVFDKQDPPKFGAG